MPLTPLQKALLNRVRHRIEIDDPDVIDVFDALVGELELTTVSPSENQRDKNADLIIDLRYEIAKTLKPDAKDQTWADSVHVLDLLEQLTEKTNDRIAVQDSVSRILRDHLVGNVKGDINEYTLPELVHTVVAQTRDLELKLKANQNRESDESVALRWLNSPESLEWTESLGCYYDPFAEHKSASEYIAGMVLYVRQLEQADSNKRKSLSLITEERDSLKLKINDLEEKLKALSPVPSMTAVVQSIEETATATIVDDFVAHLHTVRVGNLSPDKLNLLRPFITLKFGEGKSDGELTRSLSIKSGEVEKLADVARQILAFYDKHKIKALDPIKQDLMKALEQFDWSEVKAA